MFCTKCGNNIPEGTKFCTKCGAPAPVLPPKPVAPTPAPAPKAAPTPTPAPAPAPAPAPKAAPTPAPTPKPASAPVPAPTPAPKPAPQPQPVPQTYINQPAPNAKSAAKPAPKAAPAPKPAAPSVPGQKKKSAAPLIITIVVLVLILAGGGTFAYFYLTDSTRIAKEAIKKGDYKAAASVIKNIDDVDVQADLEDEALAIAEQTYNDYVGETLEYSAAKETIDELGSTILKGFKEIEAYSDDMESIEGGRNAYKAAEEAKAASNFIEAMNSYKMVPSIDTIYYPLAVKAVESCEDDFVAAVKTEVAALEAEGKTDEALERLADASNIVDDPYFTEETEIIQSMIEAETVAAALSLYEEKLAAKDYGEAFEALWAAMDDYPDNEELVAANDSLTVEFRKRYQDTTTQYYNAGMINELIDYVENYAAKYLPNDDFSALLETYKLFLPGRLQNEELFTSSNMETVASAKDTYNNEYSDVIRFSPNKTASATYFMNVHNYLTGTLAFEYYGSYSGSAVVKIYGDNTLLYTSPSFSTSTKPVDIAINLTGVHELKIEVTKSSGDANIILADAQTSFVGTGEPSVNN